MWSVAPKSTKKISQENEERLADDIGFELTPGSGNQPWPLGKGDGWLSQFMFECKETKAARIGVGARDIGKLCREAANIGRHPVLVMSAYGLPDPLPKDWVAVPSGLFREMLVAYLRETNNGEF
jgi:hypothetical protein